MASRRQMSPAFITFVRGLWNYADLSGHEWAHAMNFGGSQASLFRQLRQYTSWPDALADRFLVFASSLTGVPYDELHQYLIQGIGEAPLRVVEIQRCSFLLPPHYKAAKIEAHLRQAMESAEELWTIQYRPPMSLCDEPIFRAVNAAAAASLGSLWRGSLYDLNRLSQRRRKSHIELYQPGALVMNVLFMQSGLDELYAGTGIYSGVKATQRQDFFDELVFDEIAEREIRVFVIDDISGRMPPAITQTFAMYDRLVTIGLSYAMLQHKQSLQRSVRAPSADAEDLRFVGSLSRFIQSLLGYCAHPQTPSGAADFIRKHYLDGPAPA